MFVFFYVYLRCKHTTVIFTVIKYQHVLSSHSRHDTCSYIQVHNFQILIFWLYVFTFSFLKLLLHCCFFYFLCFCKSCKFVVDTIFDSLKVESVPFNHGPSETKQQKQCQTFLQETMASSNSRNEAIVSVTVDVELKPTSLVDQTYLESDTGLIA